MHRYTELELYTIALIAEYNDTETLALINSPLCYDLLNLIKTGWDSEFQTNYLITTQKSKQRAPPPIFLKKLNTIAFLSEHLNADKQVLKQIVYTNVCKHMYILNKDTAVAAVSILAQVIKSKEEFLKSDFQFLQNVFEDAFKMDCLRCLNVLQNTLLVEFMALCFEIKPISGILVRKDFDQLEGGLDIKSLGEFPLSNRRFVEVTIYNLMLQ